METLRGEGRWRRRAVAAPLAVMQQTSGSAEDFNYERYLDPRRPLSKMQQIPEFAEDFNDSAPRLSRPTASTMQQVYGSAEDFNPSTRGGRRRCPRSAAGLRIC